MIVAVKIKDLAIIESLELEFDQGFTVLTGETGAGKSILVDAFTLVLGARASSELIRTGAETAEVEALFNVAGSKAVEDFLADSGLEDARGHELVVRRTLARSGKNRVWINGRIESTGRLFELGRLLVDIYGQHEYQTLLKPERHRELLDSFGGLAAKLAVYREAYDEWRALKREFETLDMSEEKKREREDLLRYRVREIESAKLEGREDQALAAEREILRHAEVLKTAGLESVDLIYDADDAVAGKLRTLSQTLRDAAEHDPWFSGPAEQFEQASAILEDAARDLARHTENIEADPQRLAWVEDRIHEIKGLKKKYGPEIADVFANLAAAREELDNLESFDRRLAELLEKVGHARAAAEKLALALRKAREKTASGLAAGVEAELAGMGMDKTRFEARIVPLDDGLGPRGADAVAFYLSPNPGEDVKPLDKIASGGELSRIMLALRVLLSGEGDVLTMVFDEVDAGIGGAVAESVGKRMKRMAADHQVLCVTHLPQIAALAENHCAVVKRASRDRTRVETRVLDRKERNEELARMLAGEDITEATRAHAREMLSRAGGRAEKKKAAKKGKARTRG